MIEVGDIDELDGILYKCVRGVVDVSNIWSGPMGWVCQSCGSVIGDGKIHSKWHNDGSK